ncbi:MAG: Fic family protein [Geminicoccaceae bacterium]
MPYVPPPLPRGGLDWAALVPLIGRANRAIARYDGIVQGLVNPSVLLSPLAAREAVLSSMIEGTQTTLEELLEFEADPREDAGPRYDDIREVANYRRAMAAAIEELKSRPLSLNLLKRAHLTLMDSVRGRDKRRGEFRREQNWIAPPGTPLEMAIYVPPPHTVLAELLDNLESYLHAEERDCVVQAALIHGQFELIHPFLDGNGRVGRMLIPLFLFAAEVISTPAFYMSAYLEAHRDEYYARLRGLSQTDDVQGWIAFFLRAVIAQAEEDGGKARRILDLYDRMKVRVAELTRSQFSIRTLDVMFDHPIFSSPQFVARSGVSKASAARILGVLADHGILRVIRAGLRRRPAIYAFPELFEVLNATPTDAPPRVEATVHTLDVATLR